MANDGLKCASAFSLVIATAAESAAGPGDWKRTTKPPLRAGADPYDPAGILTYCRSCHIERHRPDNELPGRADWRDLVNELVRG